MKENLTNSIQTITLKTFYGFEQTLADELTELGYKDLTLLNRAVQLKGTWKDIYYLNGDCMPIKISTYKTNF